MSPSTLLAFATGPSQKGWQAVRFARTPDQHNHRRLQWHGLPSHKGETGSVQAMVKRTARVSIWMA
eukprot:365139-Chlamydomonas_euryale.AAC.15